MLELVVILEPMVDYSFKEHDGYNYKVYTCKVEQKVFASSVAMALLYGAQVELLLLTVNLKDSTHCLLTL